MGIPFAVVSGAIFITDEDGDIAEVVTRSNSSKALAVDAEISGTDAYGVWRQAQTVQRSDGIYALATEARVVVESTFGFDQNPDTWFRIVDTGQAGDTLTVYIAGTSNDPSIPDRDSASYTKVFTILAGEVGDEIALRDRIIQELNSDTTFNKQGLKLRAQKATDRAIVHITSLRFSLSGEFWERPFLGDFTVTPTGGADVVVGYTNIISRSKPVSISRDFDSPHRLGLFGITGQVQVTAKDLDDLIIQPATDTGFAGGDPNLLVNGQGTPQEFSIQAQEDTTIFIEELRFFGQGNGIQFKGFLTNNSPISNGIYIEIKSDDTVTQFPLIKTTADFKNKFSFGSGATGFALDIASGRDDFLAVFTFNNPFLLQPAGTFAIDDYIKVVVQDNITSSASELEFWCKGFEKEP